MPVDAPDEMAANTFGLRKLLKYVSEMESIARNAVSPKEMKVAEQILQSAMVSFPEARGALFQRIATMEKI
ncbi:MAG: hypothetical protein JEZ00_04600 [Anaerolineaceae bacterium]|nr:hypothetical protein [Anaerolineaceae bacterium]